MTILLRYNCLDIGRLVMAFLVIGIHVGAITNTTYSPLLIAIQSMAVPFFFVCSGFFLQHKTIRTEQERHTLTAYLLKILKLFILWHLAWLPIDIIFILRDNSLGLFFRNLFIEGETYFSWHLWFLHGLLVAVAIVSLMRFVKVPLPVVWLIGLLLMWLGDAGRNGLFQGMPLVTTGMIVREYDEKLVARLPLGLLCVVLGILADIHQYPLAPLLMGGGMLLVVTSVRLKDRPVYSTIRTSSMLVYFLHMYFVVLLVFLYPKLPHHCSLVYIVWGVISMLTFLTAYVFIRLSKYNYFKWLRQFMGE